MSTDENIAFSETKEQLDENHSVESVIFRRSLKLRKETLSMLCEEVKDGRLTAVNALFEPFGFAVNPTFMKDLSGRLRIMRDIEIALNELDDEALLAEHVSMET
jgi:hypothetical protein